ncbi:P-loop NTPase family protein [Marimonas lutisalis]|uniref:MinD/ParA family protein n=1 Tax=Marimonas lutisalis TaxID=2545756 RepID=UPI0010F51DD4|nr:MinD/ParA family protein [Marimonas lutisalis]
MDNQTESRMPKVLILSGDGVSDSEIENLLGTSNRLILSQLNKNNLKEVLTPTFGDILVINVMHLSEKEIELLSDVRAMVPDLPLIVVSPQLSAEETRRLFKFNIHDWMPKPVSSKDLIESVFKGIRTRKVYNNRVHAIVSAVGGSGATTLAVSMTDLAATKLFRKQSVALFDLDFSLGNCGYTVNLKNNYKLANVASTPHRVDAEFIRVIQKRHEHQFYLYSFKEPELNTEVNGYELVLRMLDAVSVEHEHTFLDIPYYETEWKDDVLSAVNTCTLVSELNLPAIKHTIDLIERIQELRGKDFPLHVVFNKWEPSLFGQRIGRKKIRELFGEVPFSYIPLAKTQIGEAVDRGVTPSDISKSSKFLRALLKYMKTLELVEAKV